MFEIGVSYSREVIARELGGGVRSYLPHQDGRVVAACLLKEHNYDPPTIILPGREAEVLRWARVLLSQGGSIPSFVKRASGEWEYFGRFEVASSSTNPEEIAQYEALTGRIEDSKRIGMVIRMRRI